jgi:predicted phage tail protein
MKTIYLHGSLKDRHPEPIKVHASSVAEALSILKQLPAFDVENPVEVRVRGFECRDALYAATDVDELHVYPALRGGGGNGGFLQIIIGAVLVVVGVIVSFIPGGQPFGISIAMSGAMMMLGGLIQLLAPSPKASTSADTSQSLYIPSNQNTTKIGTRIKLIFGTVRTFGHYLSFNVDARRLDNSTLALGGYCNYTGAGQAQNCVLG